MSEEKTEVISGNVEVISREEFDKVYKTLQKERDEKKELAKQLKGYSDYNEIKARLDELSSTTNDEDRIKKALEIRTAPLIEKEKTYLSKIQELESVVENTKKEKINGLLKEKINKFVLSQQGQFKTNSVIDIEGRVKLYGYEYNEDLQEFVCDGKNLDKFILEQSKTSTWVNETQSAGLGKNQNKSGMPSSPTSWAEYLKQK